MRPNKVWASDFTYIKVNKKNYYLCIIMDLFSRKIIGWHISAKADVNLTINTLEIAYQSRKCSPGLIIHSDRGCQYTSWKYKEVTDSLNIIHSFSKKGYPYDNSCCESFFKYLKKEETDLKTYQNYNQLYKSISFYINNFYNSYRPHSALDYKTPNETENIYWSNNYNLLSSS